jgi:hypothetical protein
MDGVTLS